MINAGENRILLGDTDKLARRHRNRLADRQSHCDAGRVADATGDGVDVVGDAAKAEGVANTVRSASHIALAL